MKRSPHVLRPDRRGVLPDELCRRWGVVEAVEYRYLRQEEAREGDMRGVGIRPVAALPAQLGIAFEGVTGKFS